MRTPLKVFLLLVLAVSPALAQKRGVTAADYYKLVDVANVAVSPDGGMAAFTVTTVVESANRRHREIWIAPLRNGAPAGEPFRFSDPSRESSQPVWSPDGTVLSFQSQRDRSRDATWFARVTAPGGEAYQLDGVRGAPVWSPDGQWIAYSWAPSADREGAKAREGWIAPNAVSKTLNAERMDGRVITVMHYKAEGTLDLLPHPSAVPQRQLYVVPATGGSPLQLTRFTFAVSQPVWSGDGRTLYFTGDSLWDIPSVRQTQDIYAVSREGGTPKRLTGNPGSEYAPAVSPDGKSLAFLQRRETGGQLDVMVVTLAADGAFQGEPRNLTGSWDL